MTILKWILLILGIIIAAPILAFLCMKLGTVGFYRGKEVSGRENEFNVKDNNNNETKS